MNELKIFNNPSFGEVRVVMNESNEPLFCLADVCKVLELHSNVVKQRLEKDVCSTYPLQTNGGTQQVTFVNEDGLYDVILDSRKAEAKVFRKWVTSEVLPSIRKDGGYMIAGSGESEEELMARALVVAQNAIKRKDERIKQLEKSTKLQDKQILELTHVVTSMETKVSYLDKIFACTSTVKTTTIAQDYGMSAKTFNSLLHGYGIQHKVGDVWVLYAKYLPEGYVKDVPFEYQKANGTTGIHSNMQWTQKGRMFLYEFLKEHDVLPLIEQK